MPRPLFLAAAALALSASCTSASVYEVSGIGQEGPDRALFQGTICAPATTGEQFPIKIIFAVEGGDPPVLPDDTSTIISTLTSIVGTEPSSTEYALLGFHTVALAFTQGFVSGGGLQTALPSLQGATAQQTGPVSLQAPLDLANAIISGDMQTSCSATLQRTHYYVMLLVASEDETCTNPVFSTALESLCQTGNNADQLETNSASPYCQCFGNAENCESCLLGAAALSLKNLGTTYGGDVTIVPIYFNDIVTQDPVILTQLGYIASAAGSSLLYYPTDDLQQDLSAYPFVSLLAQPTLTRLYAWNRNVIARQGQELVDSDGDGVPDQDEINVYGSNPQLASTAKDGISDGLKVHLGLDPTQPANLNNCACLGQPDDCQDSDSDGLNDCEEEILETNPCTADTDGDGLSDLVELHSGTNPLVPEANQDGDGDGVSNAVEDMIHSDPLSADLPYQAQRGYWSSVQPGTPTPDGRPCYDFTIGNVSLMTTLSHTDGFVTVPAGANLLYLMAEWSYGGGAEISQFLTDQVTYNPPAPASPASPILITPDEFITGT